MNDPGGIDLLRALGSGVTPNGRSSASGETSGLDFASLMSKARTGGVRSGLTVTADPSLGIELAPDQAETLSRIADLAQAQGAKRVLITDGTNSFVLDVDRRVLSERAVPGPDGLVTGIDAAVRLDQSLIGDGGAGGVSTEALMRQLVGSGRAAG